MIAVITGDIIASRKLVNQDLWLSPLKGLLASWGDSPKDWKVDRGDFFQVEIAHPEDALLRVFEIKALLKSLPPLAERKNSSAVDVRLAIGIGEKTYDADSISESNGPAFIRSGEKFDLLRKENENLGIISSWPALDEDMNLYLKLAGTFMDSWSRSSAELIQIILRTPHITQEEIGKQLGIKQNSVSGRWNRAHVKELLEVERLFRKKLKLLYP
jgi:hypothetical protein